MPPYRYIIKDFSMPEAQLTLISHPICPFVQRVAIVLHEKNMPFQRLDIDLRDKPDWFLAISPTGKVPVLKVGRDQGDAVLFESMAICEYAEDTQAEPALHPADAVLRAQHRAWIEFASSMFTDAWGFLSADETGIARKKAIAFREKLERFEADLAAGPYFGGPAFSMVDAVAAPVFRYFDSLPAAASRHLFDRLPRVAAWRQALAQRPSVQAAVPQDFTARFHRHLRDKRALLAPADQA